MLLKRAGVSGGIVGLFLGLNLGLAVPIAIDFMAWFAWTPLLFSLAGYPSGAALARLRVIQRRPDLFAVRCGQAV